MPDSRPEASRSFRWLVLIFVSLTMFGNYYVYDCIAPIADLLAKQLGYSDSTISASCKPFTACRTSSPW